MRTMAEDVLKDDINDATSFFQRILVTFCMCVGLYNMEISIVYKTRAVETAIKHFTSFVWPRHI